ncbi:sigma-54 interaction domain-containing protein [Desulfoscipio gibsoniae]|uniref:sigma-54 interaction domain-containing protein n=1 Tax=Desulfoscipio gibsoniae TaxID=102134 RepID=UPI00138AEABD|nr:sigma 54-interacting transcriptional regulator [Desulfoscipio gibsoniae]
MEKNQVVSSSVFWSQEIIDNLDVGIIAVDRNNIITVCNAFADNFLNLNSNVVGCNIYELFFDYSILKIISVGNQLSEELCEHNGLAIYIKRRKIHHRNKWVGNLYIFGPWSLLAEFSAKTELGTVGFSGGYACNDFQENAILKQLQLLEDCNIVAKSGKMLTLLDLCYKVAQYDASVLILGESGVGKEAIARYIHRASKRYDKGKFIGVNCGAFSQDLISSELFGYESGAFTGAKREGKPGLFELAHCGTLFLDEVAELPLDFQVKFLRVLQECQFMRVGGTKNIKVDVRIIAATNQDIMQMVKIGKFRSDLFYRLNVIAINVPPLRERKEDISQLVNHFLRTFNAKYQIIKLFSDETLDLLKNQDWPGNVRELANLVERLILTTNDHVIRPGHLPASFFADHKTEIMAAEGEDLVPLKEAVKGLEKQLVIKALNMYGSTYKAAKVLGVSQSTMARKAKKYGYDIS